MARLRTGVIAFLLTTTPLRPTCSQHRSAHVAFCIPRKHGYRFPRRLRTALQAGPQIAGFRAPERGGTPSGGLA